MKKYLISLALLSTQALMGMVAVSTNTQIRVEDAVLRVSTWAKDENNRDKETYGTLTAFGGTPPITFTISNIQNAEITLSDEDGYLSPDDLSSGISKQQSFKSVITDCDKPSSFEYRATDANNQKSNTATMTLQCGITLDEAAEMAKQEHKTFAPDKL